MTVNEELKNIAIEEFIKEKNEKARRIINRSMKIAVLILGLIYIVVFEAIAVREYLSGHAEDGVEIFVMGIIGSAAMLLPSCLLIWLILKRRTARESAAAEEELQKISCAIEDGRLVRYIAGDGRRTKGYKLEKISNVSKDGYIVSFDYGNTGVELLDYYEPSLYDSLMERL